MRVQHVLQGQPIRDAYLMEDRLIHKAMRSTVTRDAQLMAIPCLGGGKESCLLSVLAVLTADCLCEELFPSHYSLGVFPAAL